MTTAARGDEAAWSATSAGRPRRRFANSWATTPLRIFLSSVFLFASYAKLTYPGFFSPRSSFGFKSTVANAKHDTPLSGLMGPLADHPSLYGHITAFAELAIGLGLLVGLLTRLAALGGMVLAGSIVLSINWFEVREYTGNGGWFTSVDLAVIAALSVFLLGGAGPLSLDALFWWRRARRRAAADMTEPGYDDRSADLEDSKRRLRGEPVNDRLDADRTDPHGIAGSAPITDGRVGDRTGEQRTELLPELSELSGRPGRTPANGSGSAPARRMPVADDDSLWGEPADDDGR